MPTPTDLNLIHRAQNIRCLALDIDGVLTNGNLCYGPSGETIKIFDVHDGLGLRLLMRSGIEVAVITAKDTEMIAKRMQDLEIQHVYVGQHNKTHAFENLLTTLNLSASQIAYIGDDLPDLALIQRAGLGVSVPNAIEIVRQHADWVTTLAGGAGAVRECCDWLLKVQGHLDSIIATYLSDHRE